MNTDCPIQPGDLVRVNPNRPHAGERFEVKTIFKGPADAWWVKGELDWQVYAARNVEKCG